MKKFLIQISVFLTLLVVLLLIKSVLIEPNISNKYFVSKYEDYNQKTQNEEYNTLFFGSSRIYRHIDPELFDSLSSNLNLSSYNLGTPATFNPELYYLYEQFLDDYEKGKVKDEIDFVFIELQRLNNLTYKNALTDQGSYWNDLNNYSYSINYILEYRRRKRQKLETFYSYTLSVINRFFNVYPQLDLNSIEVDLMENGYLGLERELFEQNSTDIRLRKEEFMSDTSELAKRKRTLRTTSSSDLLSGYKIKALNDKVSKLIDQSTSLGINLIFIIPPRQDLDTYIDLYPIKKELDENIINLAPIEHFPQLYEVGNSFDVGHLNDEGVSFFTKHLYDEFVKLKNK